ncbi:hypothetical protein COU60_02770 [Candidatus Pacearchaeota archaeon CG10_big_fil_rev_8_21_14_0_10_34_76]|nr:MAG: hypothetical protein COU60_02770 [Candidatus Pacearchaeota archaeon CG10_big_fil_rev_8_21_14_0_10_34_76]
MKMKRKNSIIKSEMTLSLFIIFLQVTVFVLLAAPLSYFVTAEVGENATVGTFLQIENVFPEIISIEINDGGDVDLVANSTVEVLVSVVARDYNGDGDIRNISLVFFDQINSTLGSTDDSNNHYVNTTCGIDTAYGDAYTVQSNCTVNLWYFAYNSTWNATVTVGDESLYNTTGSGVTVVNSLLSLGLPSSIDYGSVNSTFVSGEQFANVTNFGNVLLNLSLSGYGAVENDGLAMNCTLGSIQNISAEHEKYNLTESNPGELDFDTFSANYLNLTSSPVIRGFDLASRENDTVNEAIKSTYWRIYVPLGVAGSCSGNIVFGAVQEAEA